jgi:hypothetical protein
VLAHEIDDRSSDDVESVRTDEAGVADAAGAAAATTVECVKESLRAAVNVFAPEKMASDADGGSRRFDALFPIVFDLFFRIVRIHEEV